MYVCMPIHTCLELLPLPYASDPGADPGSRTRKTNSQAALFHAGKENIGRCVWLKKGTIFGIKCSLFRILLIRTVVRFDAVRRGLLVFRYFWFLIFLRAPSVGLRGLPATLIASRSLHMCCLCVGLTHV